MAQAHAKLGISFDPRSSPILMLRHPFVTTFVRIPYKARTRAQTRSESTPSLVHLRLLQPLAPHHSTYGLDKTCRPTHPSTLEAKVANGWLVLLTVLKINKPRCNALEDRVLAFVRSFLFLCKSRMDLHCTDCGDYAFSVKCNLSAHDQNCCDLQLGRRCAFLRCACVAKYSTDICGISS